MKCLAVFSILIICFHASATPNVLDGPGLGIVPIDTPAEEIPAYVPPAQDTNAATEPSAGAAPAASQPIVPAEQNSVTPSIPENE